MYVAFSRSRLTQRGRFSVMMTLCTTMSKPTPFLCARFSITCNNKFFVCPSPGGELVLSGTLEKAQERKADALIARARLSKHHRLLDIGFGWGGISIRYGIFLRWHTLCPPAPPASPLATNRKKKELKITRKVGTTPWAAVRS